MKTPQAPASTEFVILPEVMLAWVYLLCLHIWTVWRLTTMHFPSDPDAPIRLYSGLQFGLITALDLAFFLVFVLGGWRTRNSPPSLRRGHWVSLAGSAVMMVAVQVAAYRLYGPIELP
ncbi:MAG: hypothetical protein P1V81_11210 [Planctomycetota bacterium]|nr:hypothetical protein [Planctomycetota bacterium]